mgnify:CR=1 FL=1
MAGDLREIDMTKATNMDGKKIRLVGDDGKGYWMEKEDLASVVGGLIGFDSTVFKNRANGSYDMNDKDLPSGMYGINADGINITNNNSGINYGSLLVFNGKDLSIGGNPIIQIAVEMYGNIVKLRTCWGKTSFNSWIVIYTGV